MRSIRDNIVSTKAAVLPVPDWDFLGGYLFRGHGVKKSLFRDENCPVDLCEDICKFGDT